MHCKRQQKLKTLCKIGFEISPESIRYVKKKTKSTLYLQSWLEFRKKALFSNGL